MKKIMNRIPGQRSAILKLKDAWEKLKAEKPKLRMWDAAAELGVSEAELLATRCGGSVTRLEGDWKKLIQRFAELGEVMTLTRNEHAVHEKTGTFEKIQFFGTHMGQVLGSQIDLRIFISRWHLGFTVVEESKEGRRRSFQFFDQSGSAIFKVYLKDGGDVTGFETLREAYKSDDQSQTQPVTPLSAKEPELADSEINLEGFHKGWSELRDTHAFHGLLQKFKLGRTQALRLADPQYATPVSNSSARKVLQSAAESGTSIMVFVGNPGNIQIHTGPVTKLAGFGEWYNVLDGGFNLHLRETGISQSWIVRKPTGDGIVTSLELYDERGDNIALFFGARKPGKPELEAWRKIIAGIEENASLRFR